MDESAGTPGSVPRRRCRRRGGGHPSTTAVADCLQRPTRVLGRAALGRTLSGLAPGGVYRADLVTQAAGGLLHHRFTLAARRTGRRSVLCGTVPRVTPGGCWPPPCPVEPGRSSAVVAHRRDRLADSSNPKDRRRMPRGRPRGIPCLPPIPACWCRIFRISGSSGMHSVTTHAEGRPPAARPRPGRGTRSSRGAILRGRCRERSRHRSAGRCAGGCPR